MWRYERMNGCSWPRLRIRGRAGKLPFGDRAGPGGGGGTAVLTHGKRFDLAEVLISSLAFDLMEECRCIGIQRQRCSIASHGTRARSSAKRRRTSTTRTSGALRDPRLQMENRVRELERFNLGDRQQVARV